MNNAPAKRDPTIFEIMSSSRAESDLARIAGREIDTARFAQISLTTIRSRWDDLRKCTAFSIFTAVLEAAQLGLDTSVAAGEFYFVPMKSQCVGMLGYRGMLRLAYRSGSFKKIDARLVYAGDRFEFSETEDGPSWSHTPYWQLGNDKGPIRFAYAYARMQNGEIIFKVADQDRIKAAMSASRAKHTWNAHPEPMTLKTAVRELWKWLPKDLIDGKVAAAMDDDDVREDKGATAVRVDAEWARAEFNLPPESLGELEAAPGLEPEASPEPS